MPEDDTQDLNEDTELLSLYVNKDILTPFTPLINIPRATDSVTAYVVNDSVFREEVIRETEKVYVQFEVIKMLRRSQDTDDTYCTTPTGLGSDYEDDSTEPLSIDLEKVAKGYIINCIVFLTKLQWNTVYSDDTAVWCGVCGVSVAQNVRAHFWGSHKEKMRFYQPLKRFDLSITRQIGNIYHCGVCNEIFSTSAESDHFNSESHESNLLFAINKASDLSYNYKTHRNNNDTPKKDCFRFVTNEIVDRRPYFNELLSNDSNTEIDYNENNFINYKSTPIFEYHDEEPQECSSTSYANMAKKPKLAIQTYVDIDLGNRKVKVNFDSWHMVITPKRNRYYCMVCKRFDHLRLKVDHCNGSEHLDKLDGCRVVQAFEDYFVRQVDDKLYHCGHCNNLHLSHVMKDHVQSSHPRKTRLLSDPTAELGEKHSSSKKKTKNTMNDVKNYTKDAKIKQIRSKHSNDERNRLNDTKNSSSDVTESFYGDAEAGYCDSLIKKCSRALHKQKTLSNAPTGVGNRKKCCSTPKKKKDGKENSDVNANNNIPNKMAGIFDKVIINPFGYNICIPVMSYHVVCQSDNGFYCGLCDCLCSEDGIVKHIYDIRHYELMQRTPFILSFSCHLFRAIRDALHCAICNVPVFVDEIYIHKDEPQHMKELIQALDGNTDVIPLIPVNVDFKVELPHQNSVAHAQRTPVTKKDDAKSTAANYNKKEIAVTKNDDEKSAGDNDVVNYDKKSIPGTKKGDENGTGLNKTPPCIKTDDKYEGTIDDTSVFNNDIISLNDIENKTVLNDLEDSASVPMNRTLESEDGILEKTFESTTSDEPTFDVEEYVYIKLRNTYIKITNTSYNTLVHVGDGSRYCFVCSIQVEFTQFYRHVDSKGHLKNIEKYRFLDKYEDHLLRQIYLMYHCSICNVIVTRKELKSHLVWPTHDLQNVNTMRNKKKTRKNEIKSGVKQITVSTQKENIYLNEKEPRIKIICNVDIVTSESQKKSVLKTSDVKVPTDDTKLNKIIIVDDVVMKIAWMNWHAIVRGKSAFRCYLCQMDLKENIVTVHCNSEWHKYTLEKPFLKTYAPALVRQINENLVNCLVCNTEVANKNIIITEHLNGKKHAKNYAALLEDSSNADNYSDCIDDVYTI